MLEILSALRVLGDPTRIRLLLLLEHQELTVAELQEILAKGQSQISTHLSRLKQVGLVEDRRTGKNIFYRLHVAQGAEGVTLEQLLPVLRTAAAEIPEAAEDQQVLELVLGKRKDKIRSYFDALAGRFGREYHPGRSWKGLAEVLLRLMPSMVIADLGAGEGTFSQLLAHGGGRVIAVDNSQKMVEFGAKQARDQGLQNLEYRLGDLEAIPLQNGEADVAFFSQSLHHAVHPQQAVSEAWRILRPGGRIAILDLARHQFDEARELYADVWLGFTEVELQRFLKQANFERVQTALVHREIDPPYFETVCALGDKPS